MTPERAREAIAAKLLECMVLVKSEAEKAAPEPRRAWLALWIDVAQALAAIGVEAPGPR